MVELKKVGFYFLCLLNMLLGSCSTGNKIPNQRFDINAVTEYISIKDTFDFAILHYIEGYECDTLISASESIGIIMSTNDTIRVLSLCNSDTAFHKGMVIKVVPHKKPNIEELNLKQAAIAKGRQTIYPEYYQKNLKTTFGKLL